MHIDKVTYKINAENRYKTKSPKTQIVIGMSLRKDSRHITRLQHKDYGNSKKWNTYTINRDGIVYQHYDDNYYTDFLGIKEADKCSVSIVLENMGALFQISNGMHINWLNEVCDEENVIEREWFGYYFWESFPDVQLESLILLCKEICEKHNIPKTFIEFNHYHKQIHKFKGIVFRGNYIEDSSDMNPLLEIPKLSMMLLNNNS
jgi:N-acetyl-anhydromuramyl-L-alanine amidase AmpD